MSKKTSILVIYTGGTIGMVQDLDTGALSPLNFIKITEQIPELERFNYNIHVESFSEIVDSTNMKPRHWIRMAKFIGDNYEKYDGFVILHGTDTMAYTASAISFLLNNLAKPVILTGSQLPIGEIRTDAKENLITAIEIAAQKVNGRARVPEVAIYFDYHLMRGNRSSKFNSAKFEAFATTDYPLLGEAGTSIVFEDRNIRQVDSKPFSVFQNLNTNVGALMLYPGIPKHHIQAMLNDKYLEAVVMLTYGSGNAPTDKWFLDELQASIKRGTILVNITQCQGGTVDMGRYETSKHLKEMGVITGWDMTFEAATTKLMYLLAEEPNRDKVRALIPKDLRGELTEK
ncbi:MAG: L-asparaginase [Sphingobacteriales bacterium]|jgi:L-asparaginase